MFSCLSQTPFPYQQLVQENGHCSRQGPPFQLNDCGVFNEIEGYCSGLGTYRLYGRKPAQLLFTENDSNSEKLWGQPNKSPYVE